MLEILDQSLDISVYIAPMWRNLLILLQYDGQWLPLIQQGQDTAC